MGLIGAKSPSDLINKGIDLIISTYDPLGVRADEIKAKEFFKSRQEGSQILTGILQKYNIDYNTVLVGFDEGKSLKEIISESTGGEK